MPAPPPPLGDTRVTELLHAFLVAEYRWQHEGHWHDIVIGLPTPGLELAYPEATSFGIVSAWNPHSVVRGHEDNRHADDRLHAALLESGHAIRPAFASARNRTWREPSWLVMGMERTRFDAMSRRFGQLGTLWWRPGEAVRLRMDACKPDDVDEEPYVDWIAG